MPLIKIDQLFSQQLVNLKNVIDTFEFKSQFDFVLQQTDNYTQLIKTLDYPGVYLIEIKADNSITFSNWIDYFRTIWEDPKYKDKFVPNLKTKRIKKHDNLSTWIPLYIGKSKNISKRIKEHIELQLIKPTTALKLKERTNIYGQIFRISTIKVVVSNYDLIMPQVESLMREKYHPILGRQ